MELSILILTHNRPKQFQKCIKSVVDLMQDNCIDYEIIVNNDSNDIVETYKDVTEYYYNTDDVNELYPFLYSKARGKYIYFLEDDDELLSSKIFLSLNSHDVHFGMYRAHNKSILKYQMQEFISNKRDRKYIFKYFQLSQIIFKKIPLDFPQTFHIENDEILLKSILENTSGCIKCWNLFLFKQGVDGTNLSYEEIK